MADFKFNCPHCKQSLEAPADMVGQTINCPSCKGLFKLPNPQTQRPATFSSQAPRAPSTRIQQEASDAAKTVEEPRITEAIAHLVALLVPNETMAAFTVQRRLFALTHRRSLVFATSGRLIGMTRGLFGGFTPQDVRWQDVKDARIRVGIFSAELTIEALSSPDLAISGGTRTVSFYGLRKDQTQAVYRMCQAQEQAWREKRRLRELEELRAKSGGIQLGTSVVSSMPQQTQSDGADATTRLQQAKEMLEKGFITDSEYETIKARVVSSI